MTEPHRTKEHRLRALAFHSVTPTTLEKMTALCTVYYGLGARLLEDLPESPERSLALTYLEDSCLRALQCLEVMEGEMVGQEMVGPPRSGQREATLSAEGGGAFY